MIRAWLHLAASFDRAIGIRCPLLWACSRTYRSSYHRFRGPWT